MKLFQFLLLSILPIIGSAYAIADKKGDGGPPTGPRLLLDTKEVNLGSMTRGTVATDTIGFINNGEEPLQLLSITSDCGCTAAEWSDAPLEPGERGFIIVRFDSKGRAVGKFHKTLRVKSNALNFRELLIVTGEITL